MFAALNTHVKGGDYFGPQGAGERTGKPGKAHSTILSHNTETAKKLWEISEKLTGIKYLFEKTF